MKTIYPFSPYKAPTWRNWSNYLFWLDNSINSLEDYLNYFNPNFFILNETMSYNPSNTWKEEAYEIEDTSKCWYLFKETNCRKNDWRASWPNAESKRIKRSKKSGKS